MQLHRKSKIAANIASNLLPHLCMVNIIISPRRTDPKLYYQSARTDTKLYCQSGKNYS